MYTLLVQPQNNEELKVVKNIAKALKVEFKLRKGKTYNADFIAKIEESKKQIKEGKVKKITLNEIWK